MKENEIILHYQIVKVLSSNSVYLVRDCEQPDNKQYALNLFPATDFTASNENRPFMENISHCNLIPVHEVLIQKSLNSWGIVVDFCEKGSLSSIIDRYQQPSKEFRLSVLMDVTRSLAAFFECGECHYGGLSLKKILYHDSAFKISPVLYSKLIVSKPQGKMLKQEPHNCEQFEKLMIRSLGVIFLEVLTWKKMPEGENPSQYLAKQDEICQPKIKNMLLGMLAKEESQQMKFQNVRRQLSSLLQIQISQKKSIQTVEQLKLKQNQQEIFSFMGKNIQKFDRAIAIPKKQIVTSNWQLQKLLMRHFPENQKKITILLKIIEKSSEASKVLLDLRIREMMNVKQAQVITVRPNEQLKIEEGKQFQNDRDRIKEEQKHAKQNQTIEDTFRQGCLLSTKITTLKQAEKSFQEALNYCDKFQKKTRKADIFSRLAQINYEKNDSVSSSLERISQALDLVQFEEIGRRKDIYARINRLLLDIQRFQGDAKTVKKRKAIEAKLPKQMRI